MDYSDKQTQPYIIPHCPSKCGGGRSAVCLKRTKSSAVQGVCTMLLPCLFVSSINLRCMEWNGTTAPIARRFQPPCRHNNPGNGSFQTHHFIPFACIENRRRSTNQVVISYSPIMQTGYYVPRDLHRACASSPSPRPIRRMEWNDSTSRQVGFIPRTHKHDRLHDERITWTNSMSSIFHAKDM